MYTTHEIINGVNVISILPDESDSNPFLEALRLADTYEPETVPALVTKWRKKYNHDPRYMGELACALNWHAYHLYESGDSRGAKVFFMMQEDLDYWAKNHFKGEDFSIYFDIVD